MNENIFRTYQSRCYYIKFPYFTAHGPSEKRILLYNS